MTLRALLVLAALCIGPACAALAGTRLAIWADVAARDEAALLAAKLSANSRVSGYDLLERDEFARFVTEQSLPGQQAVAALRAGRLLNAQGVVWIEKIKLGDGARIVLRLSAARSGFVAGWSIDDNGTIDSSAWAKRAARQLEDWRRRLDVPREQARAVALLNLRRAGAAPGATASEQALTVVFAQALARSPRLRLLERWRLDDLALEAALGGEAGDAFWHGAAVVDGSFTEADGEIVLNLRLRPVGRAEERWTLTGRDSGALLDAAATAVTKRILGGEEAGQTWDRAAEAREFFEEARWAARWSLHAKVVEAAEAAIVLGESSPEVRRLRYLARGRLVWGGRRPALFPDGDMAMQMTPPGLRLAAPPLPRVQAARQVLALFADHRAMPDGKAEDERPAGPPRMVPGAGGLMHMRHSTRAEMDAIELLGGAARVLREGYAATALDAPTSAALAELRRAARETFTREEAARGLPFRARVAGAGLPQPPVPGPMVDEVENLWLVAYAQGALWAERLADHQAWVAGLLAAEASDELFGQALRLTTPRRADAWEVDWATRDAAAARACWAVKAREWLRADDAALRVTGAFQLLALNSPFGAPTPGAVPGPEAELAPELARFGTPADQEARAEEAVRALANEQARAGGGMLPRSYVDAAEIALNGRVPDAAREAWVQLHAAVPAGRATAPREREVAKSPEAPVPQARQAKIPMVMHWLAPEARVPATGLDDFSQRRGIRWMEREAGRVRVITEERAEEAGGARRFTLTEVELNGFRERRLGRWKAEGPRDYNDHSGFPAFAMLGRHVFAWEGGQLWRRQRDGGVATRIALPVEGQARLWALAGWLYVASDEGAILRVHPETGAWEMLAGSRRRPAEGPLDDQARYEVLRMWLASDGAVRVCATTRGEQIFRRDEAKRTWVLEAEKPHGNLPGFRYQRAECLAWLEGIDLAASGYGRAEVERLLRDVKRGGDWRVPSGFSLAAYYLGDPRAGELGGMTRGGDVWALYYFWNDHRRSPRLVCLPAVASGRDAMCAELEVPDGVLRQLSANPADLLYGGIGGGYARLSGGPEGLVIYAEGSPVLWFVSKARLEMTGMAWPE